MKSKRPSSVIRHAIARSPLLSRDEERDLIVRAQAGDTAARDRLVECNLRLVAKVTNELAGNAGDFGLSADDLAQEGVLGLMHAVERFDLTRTTRLSAYAIPWIRQYAIDALRDRGAAIRIPKRGREILEREGRPVPHVGCGGGGSQSPVDPAPTPEHESIAQSRAAGIRRWAWRLPRRLALVIRLRFGLDDGEPQTLAAIGRRLKVSRERVRQLEAEALDCLRRWAAPTLWLTT